MFGGLQEETEAALDVKFDILFLAVRVVMLMRMQQGRHQQHHEDDEQYPIDWTMLKRRPTVSSLFHIATILAEMIGMTN